MRSSKRGKTHPAREANGPVRAPGPLLLVGGIVRVQGAKVLVSEQAPRCVTTAELVALCRPELARIMTSHVWRSSERCGKGRGGVRDAPNNPSFHDDETRTALR